MTRNVMKRLANQNRVNWLFNNERPIRYDELLQNRENIYLEHRGLLGKKKTRRHSTLAAVRKVL